MPPVQPTVMILDDLDELIAETRKAQDLVIAQQAVQDGFRRMMRMPPAERVPSDLVRCVKCDTLIDEGELEAVDDLEAVCSACFAKYEEDNHIPY